jgi:hypothetical protein
MTVHPSIDQWQEWNAQGFIPGPNEDEVGFEKRIDFCQNIREHLLHQTEEKLPFDTSDPTSQTILEEALPKANDLYGIAPKWVPLIFSNHQLSPWHGGCAWIFQLNAEAPTSTLLQLRSRFRRFSTYLGLYDRNELIVHELAHVGRMAYQEPKFEEMLAYQSSLASWRRWLGPIVQSSKESFAFVLILGLAILADAAFLSAGAGLATAAFWIKLVPIILLLMAIGRLIYRHYCFDRCLEKLKVLLNPRAAQHLLYRLQDCEIKLFAQLSPMDISEWIEKASHQHFRWRFLKTIYLNEEGHFGGDYDKKTFPEALEAIKTKFNS